MTSKVYLVDGSGYIFRAYYAVSPLSTKSGFPTNALYGFTRMLLRLLKEAESEHIIVAFDTGRETFRLKLYPEYKANRTECPEDLSQQMPYFRDITKCLGIGVLELPGYEADDIIGTLCTRLVEEKQEVVIISGDKDLMQLVGPNVTMWDTLNDRHYGPKEVEEKFGVPPEKVTDILALMGDSSDNVPGLEGVGPKTASQLVQKYGDIKNILQSVEIIKEDESLRGRKKIVEQLELNAELLRLSRQLVELERNAPVTLQDGSQEVKLATLKKGELFNLTKRQPLHEKSIRALFEKFDFTSLLESLNFESKKNSNSSLNNSSLNRANYITIWGSNFLEWLDKFLPQKEFAFDIETTSLNIHEAHLVGISLCWDDDVAYYIPLQHKNTPGQVSLDTFLNQCAKIFQNEKVKKYGQNLKYDTEVLAKRYSLSVKGLAFDTMVGDYLLRPDRGSYNLSVLAHEYLERTLTEYEEVTAEKKDFSEVSIEDATAYAAQDSHCAWLITKKLRPLIEAANLWKVFSEIEMPLVSVLADIESKGMGLDCELLAKMSEEFVLELDKAKTKIFSLVGYEFNLNSPKQLSEVLFDKLQIPTRGLKRTKTGISTDFSVLEKLALVHEVPAHILHHRFLYKLKSTYLDVLPRLISPITGRLHTKLNQTGTGTGRLSSSEPNLQNIPIHTPQGKRIRAAFVAPPEAVLISADYSQIELRLLAHMSEDQSLIQVFKEDIDIHSRTAREILGLKESDEVDADQRRFGKTINFGIVYGMSSFRLARDLGISLRDAQKYIDNYFSCYPGVKQYFAKVEQEAQETGVVQTIFGRKRVLADIDISERDKGFLSRVALNAPLQGSAADVIKCAMINIHKKIEEQELPLSMVLQIHDELLFECKESWKEAGIEFIRREMEQVLALLVPLKVEVGYGKNWLEAHA